MHILPCSIFTFLRGEDQGLFGEGGHGVAGVVGEAERVVGGYIVKLYLHHTGIFITMATNHTHQVVYLGVYRE